VELNLLQRRIEFYTQKLTFLANRGLNTDLLYALAELNERRAERQLEAAIALAYLYERAVAFFLGEPNIRNPGDTGAKWVSCTNNCEMSARCSTRANQPRGSTGRLPWLPTAPFANRAAWQPALR
jgi:hypothetical protein